MTNTDRIERLEKRMVQFAKAINDMLIATNLQIPEARCRLSDLCDDVIAELGEPVREVPVADPRAT